MTDKEILLTYAVERLSKRTKPTRAIPTPYIYFAEYFGDFPKTEDELKNRLGRKWKSSLSSIGSFFNEYKYITNNYLDSSSSHEANNPSLSTPSVERFDAKGKEEPTNRRINLEKFYDSKQEVPILHLSTTNRNLVSLFGSSRNVSNLLQRLVDIRGLDIVDASYSFGDTDSHPKTYAYNKAVEKLVLSVVKKYNIPIAKKSLTVVTPQATITNRNQEVVAKVKVSSKISNLKCSDNECAAILWQKYGKLIQPRLKKLNAMNAELPQVERIKFNWRVHRSFKNFITKISIRATSEICAYKKSENDSTAILDAPNSDFSFIEKKAHWRTAYLDQQLGRKRWTEYDISGSIYQINHLLTHGEWLGNATDPYRIMFGSAFDNAEARTAYKSLCMALYFDRTPRTIVSHNAPYTQGAIRRHGKEKLTAILSSAEEAMRGFTGSKLDSEIFLHESLLYTDFIWELRQKGIKVVQVYDGFFLPKDSFAATDLESLMRECATRYAKDYAKWLKSSPSAVQGASKVAVAVTERRQAKREGRRSPSAAKGG